MTRNYVALFISTVAVLTALFEGVLGIQGFVVNSILEDKVAHTQQIHDLEKLELNNLETRLQSVWDMDELLDEARVMGYVELGETVYFFSDGEGRILSSEEDTVESPEVLPEEGSSGKVREFKGLSLKINFFISLIISMVLTVGLLIISKRHEKMVLTIQR